MRWTGHSSCGQRGDRGGRLDDGRDAGRVRPPSACRAAASRGRRRPRGSRRCRRPNGPRSSARSSPRRAEGDADSARANAGTRAGARAGASRRTRPISRPSPRCAPRVRHLLILRTAWLCGNDVLWSRYASGLTADERRRVAQGRLRRRLERRRQGAAQDRRRAVPAVVVVRGDLERHLCRLRPARA